MRSAARALPGLCGGSKQSEMQRGKRGPRKMKDFYLFIFPFLDGGCLESADLKRTNVLGGELFLSISP